MNRILALQSLSIPAPVLDDDFAASTSSYEGCTCSTSSNSSCEVCPETEVMY